MPIDDSPQSLSRRLCCKIRLKNAIGRMILEERIGEVENMLDYVVYLSSNGKYTSVANRLPNLAFRVPAQEDQADNFRGGS